LYHFRKIQRTVSAHRKEDHRLRRVTSLPVLLARSQGPIPQRNYMPDHLVSFPDREGHVDKLAFSHIFRCNPLCGYDYSFLRTTLVHGISVQRTQEPLRSSECLAVDPPGTGPVEYNVLPCLQFPPSSCHLPGTGEGKGVLSHSLEEGKARYRRMYGSGNLLLFSRFSGSRPLGSKRTKNETPKSVLKTFLGKCRLNNRVIATKSTYSMPL